MKKNLSVFSIAAMLLAIVWSANTFAQTIKTYNGGMDLPEDAFFLCGTSGYGSY